MRNLFYRVVILLFLLLFPFLSYSKNDNNTHQSITNKKNSKKLSIEERKKKELEKNLKFWEKTLKYGTVSQKRKVINYIKVNKIKEAVKLLTKYFDSQDNVWVKRDMISALVEFSNTSVVIPSISKMFERKDLDSETKKFLIETVDKLKYKKYYKKILKFLNDKDIYVKERAIRALGKLGVEKVVNTLITNYKKEKNDRLRTAYILSLAEIKSKKAEPILLSVFTNTDEKPFNRSYAATGLGNLKDKTALKVLMKYLDKSKGMVKQRIIDALGNYDTKEVREKLIKLLEDDDKNIRYFAIKSIEKLRIKEALEVLRYKEKYDPEYKVRIAAKEAIEKMEGKRKNKKGDKKKNG